MVVFVAIPGHRFARRVALSDLSEILLATTEATPRRLVIVKRLLPHLLVDLSFVHIYIVQAKLAAQLRHPNIAQVYETQYDRDQGYLTMEYVQGEDLRALRIHAPPPPPSIAARIITDAASGLAHAHQSGLIHGGLRPTNVMVNYEGRTKILDFGLQEANLGHAYCRPQSLGERYAYLAPEARPPRHQRDAAADVFALGVLFFELLTGRMLFGARTPPDVLRAVQRRPIPRLETSVPEALDALMRAALARDPSERPSSEALLGQLCSLPRDALADPAKVQDWMRAHFAQSQQRRRSLERALLEEAPRIEPTQDLPNAFAATRRPPQAPRAQQPKPTTLQRWLRYFR